MPSSIVTNASPLIALHQIGHLELLPHLFDTILIPPAVAAEIATIRPQPEWLQEQVLSQPIGPQILRISLGPGESEAISLALEIESALILLDDRPARRLAQMLGLSVVGTLGILLAAKKHELITEVRPLLSALRTNNFHIADTLYEMVLRDARESDS